MALMRRVDSRVGSAPGADPTGAPPQGSGRARSDKGSKLLVQPAELARKLVKEMEGRKVLRPTRVLVCNSYTIYLCRADHERLRDREQAILAKLERHLTKYARAKKYEVLGSIAVSMVRDTDLTTGHFGILAERVDPARVEGPGRAVSTTAPTTSVMVAAADRATSASPSRASVPGTKAGGGVTKVIRPGEAAQLGLAYQTIVLKAGDRVREFNHGRVVVGRARNVDFRIDDPNVSRRHAAIYWADGGIMVQDLDSTNGTLVNGYPVTNTMLRPDDVLVVGDCRITVETK
ncbi:MAG: DUF3662 and FHA domain-containing protein [bacterium]